MEIKREHFCFVIYQDVLFIEAFGSWDQKIARKGLLCFTDLVFQHYINKEWALLADIKECNFNIEKARAVLQDIFNGITMMPTHVAHIVGEPHPSKAHWKLNQPMKTRGDLQIAFFATPKEAGVWLESFGFKLQY